MAGRKYVTVAGVFETEADAQRMADEDNAVREKARTANDERLDELEDEFGV